jgi:hypothetical protein
MSKKNTGKKLVNPYFYGEIHLVDNEDDDRDIERLQNLGIEVDVKMIKSMALVPLEHAILTPAVDTEGNKCVKVNYGDGYPHCSLHRY